MYMYIVHCVCIHYHTDPGQRLALFHKHKNQFTDSGTISYPTSTHYEPNSGRHSIHSKLDPRDEKEKDQSLYQ